MPFFIFYFIFILTVVWYKTNFLIVTVKKKLLYASRLVKTFFKLKI